MTVTVTPNEEHAGQSGAHGEKDNREWNEKEMRQTAQKYGPGSPNIREKIVGAARIINKNSYQQHEKDYMAIVARLLAIFDKGHGYRHKESREKACSPIGGSTS
ncbi:MAG: hypothetical protein ACLFU6_00415 [Candidatus Hydrogenedentota bacterium]